MMKTWQKIVSEHHDIKIIDDTKIEILNIWFNPALKISGNDTLTRLKMALIKMIVTIYTIQFMIT